MKEETPQEFIISSQQQRKCPFCSYYGEVTQHIPNCPGISPGSIIDKPTFFIIDPLGKLCKNCLQLFTPLNWEKHRKSQECRRKPPLRYSGQHVIEGDAEPLQRSQSIFEGVGESERNPSVAANNLIGEEGEKVKDMILIATSIMTSFVKDWMKIHDKVSKNVLIAYLTSAFVSFGNNFLTQQIQIPTWSVIHSKGGKNFPWKQFLEHPENLFCSRFLDEKLKKMNDNRRLTAVKGLNRLSKVYPGLVHKRELPTVQRKNRVIQFVCISDLLNLIKSLLETKKRRVIHFGLDLYIILLCGQRFLADAGKIKEGVRQLLEKNRGKSKEQMQLSFSMVIGKTHTKTQVCLNTQLILMLLEFQWTCFHFKTYRLVRRMSEWLGIHGYSFKSALLNAAATVASNLQIPQRMAGHKSLTNTAIYTQPTVIGDTLKITSQLVVPSLAIRFGDYNQPQLKNYLDSLRIEGVHYAKFLSNWSELLYSRLYSLHFESQFEKDEICDFMEGMPPKRSLQKLTKKSQCKKRGKMKKMTESDGSRQEEGENSQRQKELLRLIKDPISSPAERDVDSILSESHQEVMIFGVNMSFQDNKFTQNNFYQQYMGFQQLSCFICRKAIPPAKTRLKCIYCLANTHVACAGTICPCINQSQIVQYPIICPLPKVPRTRPPSILLPPKFMAEKENPEEQQIRILLAARRFRYTRVAIVPPGRQISFPPGFTGKAAHMELSTFQYYLKGNYFPPIEARPIQTYEMHPVYGVEWGIFARDRIPTLTLIGEYGTDLINGKNIITCKQPNAIMRYSDCAEEGPEDLYLAPRQYCGYIPLVNTTTSKKQCNCCTVRVVLGDCLRILLLSKRVIKKDEQLTYCYGENYPFSIEELAEN